MSTVLLATGVLNRHEKIKGNLNSSPARNLAVSNDVNERVAQLRGLVGKID